MLLILRFLIHKKLNHHCRYYTYSEYLMLQKHQCNTNVKIMSKNAKSALVFYLFKAAFKKHSKNQNLELFP